MEIPNPCCNCKKKDKCDTPCQKKKQYNLKQKNYMMRKRTKDPERQIIENGDEIQVVSRNAGSRVRHRTTITPQSTSFFPPTDNGGNTQIMSFLMQLTQLMPVDMNNAEEVGQRIAEYIQICVACDAKPSVASMALALGCDRTRLWEYKVGKRNGKPLPQESCELVRRAYTMLNASLEQSMMENKVQQVSGIFLLKSNFGYKDDQNIAADTDKSGDAERARKAAEYKEMLENSK